MSSPVQAHSKAIFRDSALGALVHAPTPAYLKYSGADVVFSADRPEELAFYQLYPNGDYALIDLTHRGFLVASGADYTIDDVGPAVAIFVASGADFTISANLLAEPAADLFYDIAGDIWLVPRSADRLDAAQVGDDIYLY